MTNPVNLFTRFELAFTIEVLVWDDFMFVQLFIFQSIFIFACSRTGTIIIHSSYLFFNILFFIFVLILVYKSTSDELTTIVKSYFFLDKNNITNSILISSILIYDFHSNIPNFDLKVYIIK